MRTTTWIGVAVMLLALFITTEGCSIRYRCGTTTTSYHVKCGFFGWGRCKRYRTQAKICTKPCPVDAKMSAWSSWRSASSCSRSCGTGYMKYKRTRSCTPPRYGGKACSSTTAYDARTCNTQHCPVDAKMMPWSAWKSVSSCSRSCGTGFMKYKRTRSCIPPLYGGKACSSTTDSETRKCNTQHCPVDAKMSAWSTWKSTSTCSKSCGTGYITFRRSRTCTPPRYGGKACSSSTAYETRKCNTQYCPVDAVMSEWSSWEPTDGCSEPCGTGQMTFQRTRACVPAKYGGKQCDSLSETDIRECNTEPCPVDAVMSEWSSWEPTDGCSEPCGTGQMTFQRTRTCVPAKYGGKQCDSLSETDIRECNTEPCPVDGQWSEFSTWRSYSECSVSCAGGTQTRSRTRTCSAPKPQYGGSDCEGDATQIDERECNTQPCPIHGKWTEWEDWTPMDNCPVLCGGGEARMVRNRSCSEPEPMYGGNNCDGDDVEFQNPGPCNMEPCGDLCPEGERKFHPHVRDNHFYYKCDDHQVARLTTCADLSTWNQGAAACAPMTCNMTSGLNHAHPTACNKYIFCLMGHRVVERNCPPGLAWNDQFKRCEEAENGQCFF